MLRETEIPIPRGMLDEDHRALSAASSAGAALCTLVGIDGSFSRRLGAQIAVLPDGEVVGSLADGCLEKQIVSDCRGLAEPVVKRYGRGSPLIDFRLPCGGGLDILIDPAPDRQACANAMERLAHRQSASIPLPVGRQAVARSYIPGLRIVAFGEGPELATMRAIGRAAGIEIDALDKDCLTLGRASGRQAADEWTATLLLFHDHEWELALLEEALEGRSFYIGAQGGGPARAARLDALRERGVDDRALGRIRSPIGSPPGSRTPQALALAVLAEIAHEYERLRPAI